MTPGRLGVAAAAFAAACALMLAIVAAANRSPGAPQEVPYAPVLGLMLAAPAGIGVLGAMSGRRVLLVAAGVACLAQSAIAFSGVTLVFLVPALLFLRAGIAGDGTVVGIVGKRLPYLRISAHLSLLDEYRSVGIWKGALPFLPGTAGPKQRIPSLPYRGGSFACNFAEPDR